MIEFKNVCKRYNTGTEAVKMQVLKSKKENSHF